jgi:hypothetical protein
MPGIAAGGVVGVALETTPGTYAAPTKFLLLDSESLQYGQDTVWRRPLRNTADPVGTVPGNVTVTGDAAMDFLADGVLYFLLATRCTVVKSGTGPFVYTFTPTAQALPTRTLSITVVRNGAVFGYTGCVVGSFQITTDNGILKFSATLVGRDEAVQSAPTPTYPTSEPIGAGSYDIQIPTSTQVFDTDTFTFSVEDNAEAQYRLKNTGRGAQFIKYGERSTTLAVERDFENRTEYDSFKALTAQSVTIEAASQTGDEAVTIVVPAAIKDTYNVALGGAQGDLIRASVSYTGVTDGSGVAYTLALTTDENVTLA